MRKRHKKKMIDLSFLEFVRCTNVIMILIMITKRRRRRRRRRRIIEVSKVLMQ